MFYVDNKRSSVLFYSMQSDLLLSLGISNEFCFVRNRYYTWSDIVWM